MADAVPDDGNPFDVQTVKHLVALMSRHDLSEIDLRNGQARIRLRRGIAPMVTAAIPASPLVSPAPAPTAAPAAQSPAEKPAEQAGKAYHEIKSPGVGTFYDREKPEAAPYVTKGSRLTPTTVVGLIEAMKLFSEVPAECSGVVVEVVAQNGQPVDYNTVLFRVDTSS